MENCFCHFNGYKVKDADAHKLIEQEVKDREMAVAAVKKETEEISAVAVRAAAAAAASAEEAAQYAGNVGDIFNVEWESGGVSIANGAEYENETCIRSGYIPILNGSIGVIIPDNVEFELAEFNSNLEFIQSEGYPETWLFEGLEGAYARITAYYKEENAAAPELGELITVYAQRAVPYAVRYDEQTLTDEQQAQARENIGAASKEYVDDCVTASKTEQNHEYPLTIVNGNLVNKYGELQTFQYGRYAETAVVAGNTIRITGYQWDGSAGYCLYCFYDENGNKISQYTFDTNGKEYTNEVVVPNGSVKLRVNGSTFGGKIAVVGEFTKPVPLAQVVEEIEEEIETLKNSDAEIVKPKIITLGDSITALGTGERGWVGYFIEKTGCDLIANVAVVGAWLMDKAGTVYDGNPVFDGADNNVNNVLGNQVQKIINNNYDAPDIILISIGTNGGISITKDQMRAAYFDAENNLIPLENVDRTTGAGAYRYALEKLHNLYPNAQIFWCAPIHGYHAIRHPSDIAFYAESLQIATEYTGQVMIDTIRCGINGINEVNGASGQYLIDGLHPNVNGAKKIGYYNASKVMPFIGNNFELT